ncbi:hypothetical protein EWH99_01125 [Sporolactobacillus sp. THM7-7]|nr:hypothetical protein EWH99_01125 [Sporolactobacillus sp. THM7-7]
MGTAAARTLLLILLLIAGFGKLMTVKIIERALIDLVFVFMAVELSVIAIIRPEEPFVRFLVPVLLVIGIYRIRLFSAGLAGRPGKKRRSSKVEGRDESPAEAARRCFPRTFTTSGGPPHPPMGLSLIESGKVRDDHLKQIGRTPLWLRQELRKFGYRDVRQVNYLIIDESGNFFMDLKDRGNRTES